MQCHGFLLGRMEDPLPSAVCSVGLTHFSDIYY